MLTKKRLYANPDKRLFLVQRKYKTVDYVKPDLSDIVLDMNVVEENRITAMKNKIGEKLYNKITHYYQFSDYTVEDFCDMIFSFGADLKYDNKIKDQFENKQSWLKVDEFLNRVYPIVNLAEIKKYNKMEFLKSLFFLNLIVQNLIYKKVYLVKICKKGSGLKKII